MVAQISSALYQDDGYLFFHVEPVETAVYNDTIDHEIRISEGPQARIKNVTIAGNEKTKDHVIRRELQNQHREIYSAVQILSVHNVSLGNCNISTRKRLRSECCP